MNNDNCMPMSLEERNKSYERFIEAWGTTSQLIMVIEETAELQKEITKHLRGRNNIQEILEELADVEIMLEQLKLIFNITQLVIDKKKDEKIKRAIAKINNYSK